MIISNMTLVGYNLNIGCSSSFMADFEVLKYFNILINDKKDPRIKEVIWLSLHAYWIKWNIYVTAKSFLCIIAWGSILGIKMQLV